MHSFGSGVAGASYGEQCAAATTRTAARRCTPLLLVDADYMLWLVRLASSHLRVPEKATTIRLFDIVKAPQGKLTPYVALMLEGGSLLDIW